MTVFPLDVMPLNFTTFRGDVAAKDQWIPGPKGTAVDVKVCIFQSRKDDKSCNLGPMTDVDPGMSSGNQKMVPSRERLR